MLLLGVGEEDIESGLGVGAREAGLVGEGLRKVGLERFIDHVVDDGTRGVEGAGLLAGGGLGLLVVGGEEVLEDFS